MAAKSEKFIFIDYLASEPKPVSFDNHESWAETILQTHSTEIIKSQVWRTPLKILGSRSLGNAVKDWRLFGKDHYFHHRYIVLTLRRTNGNEEKIFYMSIEKGQMGILVQKHDTVDRVAKSRFDTDSGKEKVREYLEEIEAKDLTGIHRLEYDNLPAISELLDTWALRVHYSLKSSNCQTLVRYVSERIVQASNGFALHLPGTNEKANIDDREKLLSYFESRFPGWNLKKLVLVPEVQIQYSVGVKDVNAIEREQQMMYDQLDAKQKGCRGVSKALSGEAFRGEEKALFFNMTHAKAKESVEKDIEDKILVEIVSDFWRENFEMVAITSGHGIFIIGFSNPEWEAEREAERGAEREAETEETKMETLANILKDLGGFSDSDKCITTVLLDMDRDMDMDMRDCQQKPPKPIISKSIDTQYGFFYKAGIQKNVKFIVKNVKFIVKKIARQVGGKIKTDSELEQKLELLAVKLTVLQNMENETNLVHHKLNQQEWGQPGVMLWTEAQRKCIDLGRNAFESPEKPLRLIIRGCQGSGKTLLLLKMASEFIFSQQEKLLLISVNPQHRQLNRELQEKIGEDEVLSQRVVLGFFSADEEKEAFSTPGKDDINASSIGSIFFDEYEALSIASSSFIIPILRLCSTLNIHVILATSKQHCVAKELNKKSKNNNIPRGDSGGETLKFQEETLEGNLRSSPAISEMTARFQQVARGKGKDKGKSKATTRPDRWRYANIDVQSALECLSVQDPPPEIICVKYDDRDKFIERVIHEARECLTKNCNINVAVITHCHLSTVAKMKDALTTTEREQISFSSPREVLGCQFPVVILAIDAFSVTPHLEGVTDALTRSTTIIKCVVNTSRSSLMIGERPSVTTKKCQLGSGEVASYLRQLTTSCDGSIVVIDNEKHVTESERSELDRKIKFINSNVDVDSATEFSATEFSLAVEVCPHRKRALYSTASHAPYVQVVMAAENHEKPENLNAETEQLVKFFQKWAKS